jgi:putative transcriptional regulator
MMDATHRISNEDPAMNSLKGHLLIATPQLLTPAFARSVILMLEHGEDGAMGVILNQPLSTTVTDLAGKIFEDDFDWDKPLHLGGPVPGPLMVLHALEGLADREVLPGVYHTIEAALVQEVIRRRPEPSLVVANYSGWGPGQLEGEFGWDSWTTLPATPEHVFWSGEKELWQAVVNQVHARTLSEFLKLDPRGLPPDPSLN